MTYEDTNPSYEDRNPGYADTNPLLVTAVESVTRAMAGAFDRLWTKPNAAEVMEGFLADRISFLIRRDGLLVVERTETPGGDPPSGDGDGAPSGD